MSFNRRNLFQGLMASAGLATAGKAVGQHVHAPDPEAPGKPGQPAGRFWEPRSGIPPVEMPDVLKTPYRLENAVKVFHISAEPVRTQFVKGRAVDAWGFNGSVPGPTIEVNEGDRVRFVVENRLPEVFTMHWHGLEVPIEMDGVPGSHPGSDPAGRELRLRVHAPPARDVLLPLAHADAGDDGHDRPLHHPSARAVHAARRSGLRPDRPGVGASSRTTRSPTRCRWSSTG